MRKVRRRVEQNGRLVWAEVEIETPSKREEGQITAPPPPAPPAPPIEAVVQAVADAIVEELGDEDPNDTPTRPTRLHARDETTSWPVKHTEDDE